MASEVPKYPKTYGLFNDPDPVDDFMEGPMHPFSKDGGVVGSPIAQAPPAVGGPQFLGGMTHAGAPPWGDQQPMNPLFPQAPQQMAPGMGMQQQSPLLPSPQMDPLQQNPDMYNGPYSAGPISRVKQWMQAQNPQLMAQAGAAFVQGVTNPMIPFQVAQQHRQEQMQQQQLEEQMAWRKEQEAQRQDYKRQQQEATRAYRDEQLVQSYSKRLQDMGALDDFETWNGGPLATADDVQNAKKFIGEYTHSYQFGQSVDKAASKYLKEGTVEIPPEGGEQLARDAAYDTWKTRLSEEDITPELEDRWRPRERFDEAYDYLLGEARRKKEMDDTLLEYRRRRNEAQLDAKTKDFIDELESEWKFYQKQAWDLSKRLEAMGYNEDINYMPDTVANMEMRRDDAQLRAMDARRRLDEAMGRISGGKSPNPDDEDVLDDDEDTSGMSPQERFINALSNFGQPSPGGGSMTDDNVNENY